MTTMHLFVPPLIKHTQGPMLGPAMLAGAAARAGHALRVVDLNEAWLEDNLPPSAWTASSAFVGDHDRPSAALRLVQDAFTALMAEALPVAPSNALPGPDALALPYDHGVVCRAARRLAAGPLGAWYAARLPVDRPDVLGVSVMYAGQVLAALTLTEVLRDRWPGVPVVWGGAHVTALQDAIAEDAGYRRAADGFVFGYAERTLVDLLDAIGRGGSWPGEVVVAGSGRAVRAREDVGVVPRFGAAPTRGRLTLPVQASRGCAYGRCAFCTYPAIEGGVRPGSQDVVEAVVCEAVDRGARVSFKDSLVTPRDLASLAERIAGRVTWSACTKLHPRFADEAFVRGLVAGGCSTLEFGVETLSDAGQASIGKRQPRHLVSGLLDAAQAAGLPIVLNYITGLPGADPMDEEVQLAWLRDAVARHPDLVAKIEHNDFQLERRSPMGQDPARWDMVVTGSWPWSTLLAFRRRCEIRGSERPLMVEIARCAA